MLPPGEEKPAAINQTKISDTLVDMPLPEGFWEPKNNQPSADSVKNTQDFKNHHADLVKDNQFASMQATPHGPFNQLIPLPVFGCTSFQLLLTRHYHSPIVTLRIVSARPADLPSQDHEESKWIHTKFSTFPVPKTFLNNAKKAAEEAAAVAVSQAAKDVAKEAAKKAVAAQAESKQKKNKSVPSKAERVDLSKSAKAKAAVKI